MIAKKGYKRVAMIAQDYSFGRRRWRRLRRSCAQISPSAKIVAELYHPVGDEGLRPLREPA